MFVRMNTNARTNSDAGRLRVGMVGMGMIFDETYRPFLETAARDGVFDPAIGRLGIELTAVASRTGSRAETYRNNAPSGQTAFLSCVEPNAVDQLLESDVDLVCVASPDDRHFEAARAVIEAGKHVLSACPAGLTLDELVALVDTVQTTGKIYMIAETSYYYRGAIYARQAWNEGRFGDFVYGEGEYYYRPHAYGFWMRDYYGNMPPMLYPTHSTTMVISVTGKRYERVTCVGTPGLHRDVLPKRRRKEWKDNQFSNMTMLGHMSGGGVCRINEMRNVGCKGEHGSLLGTKGRRPRR